MKNLISKISNRLVKFYGHDFFSFISQDRSKHLQYIKTLKQKFPKPSGMKEIENYSVPPKFLEEISQSSVILTGGVEFHIEFEDALDQIAGACFHFFEIDERSIKWFKENKAKKNFKINSMGLGSEKKLLPVYGNINMGFSSSAEPDIYKKSKLNFEKIGESKITTVKDYCEENKISEIFLLKLDIEGMALEVLNSCWDSGIYPQNIILEIERPPAQKFLTYFEIIESFISKAHLLEYELIFLPRGDSYNSFTAEFFLAKL